MRDQSTPLADQGFMSPHLPVNLPKDPVNGFFEPISMIVVGPPFSENHSSQDRPFQVIWIPPNSSSICSHTLSGFEALMAFSQSPNRFLILPFHESVNSRQKTLASILSRFLPQCWSRQPQASAPLGAFSHPYSSLGSEGQV